MGLTWTKGFCSDNRVAAQGVMDSCVSVIGWVKAGWQIEEWGESWRQVSVALSWLWLCFISASRRTTWKSTTYNSGTFLGILTRMETWRSLWQPSGEPWCRYASESRARILFWQVTALGKALCCSTATSQPCCWHCSDQKLKFTHCKSWALNKSWDPTEMLWHSINTAEIYRILIDNYVLLLWESEKEALEPLPLHTE